MVGRAQIADGSIAPDFTVTDLDGNVHNLYSYLDAGKHVVLDFSATWCGPCWSYHNSGTLETLYDDLGPNGADEIMVFYIEADLSTAEECLYGNCMGLGGTTQGNWVAGTPYPIVNLTASNGPNVGSDYQIAYYPTLYAINAHDKRVFEVGQPGVAGWVSWLEQSFEMEFTDNVIDAFPCPATGEISLNVSNGYSTISYDWSNGGNTSTLSNLSNGSYDCVISDANGYFLSTPTYAIGGPEDIAIETQLLQNVLCGGENSGALEIEATGGNGGFSYSWSNGYSGPYLNSLEAGTYDVTATDAFGCELLASYEITQPAPLLGSTSFTDPACGQTNGEVTISTEAGTAPFTFELGGNTQSDPTFTGLAGGIYNYTIIDDNGCLFTDNVTLTSSVAPIATTAALGAISCVNLSTLVSGMGSSTGSGFTYLWSTANGNIVSGANTLDATVNMAGTYTLLVTNTSNGCTQSSSVSVTANTLAPTAAIQAPAAITCVATQVTIDASQSSTGSGFTYAWSSTDGIILSGGTTLNPIVTAAGTYSLLITNTSNGCTTTGTATVAANTTAPTLTAADGVLTCSEPSASICATSDAVSFLWNVTDNNTSSCLAVTQGGVYTVTATGANGCTSTATATVTVSNDFPQLSAATPGLVTCAVNEITLTGSVVGDVADFTFNWTSVDGLIVSGANTLTPVVSSGGEYILVATNINTGCSSNITVEVDELSAAPLSTYSGALNGNILSVSAVDADPSTTYNWDFGNGSTSTDASAMTTYTASGVYNVCLTTTNVCGSNTTCVEYTYSTLLTVAIVKGDVTCFGAKDGSVTLNIVGGLAPYTITWTGPSGFTSDMASIVGLAAGAYDVSLVDADNNTFTQLVTITEPSDVVATSTEIVNDTDSMNEGSVTLSIDGGVAPYLFTWSNGQTGPELTGVSAGSYTCEVKDVNGCTKTFGPYVVDNLSSVEESLFVNQFSIFPNPVSNSLRINIDFVNNTDSEISILNGVGTSLLSRKYVNNIADNVDVSSLPSGVYFIQVKGVNFNIAKKFVVIK